jgi:hypothetical protein
MPQSASKNLAAAIDRLFAESNQDYQQCEVQLARIEDSSKRGEVGDIVEDLRRVRLVPDFPQTEANDFSKSAFRPDYFELLRQTTGRRAGSI